MIHGFYYGTTDGVLRKIAIPDDVMQYFESKLEPRLQDVDPETYWRQYAKGMITHVAQGYLAWKGASVWVLNDGELKVVEFTPDSLRACTVETSDGPTDDLDEQPEDDLCQIPWDWMLEDDCKGRKLDKSEIQEIENNVDWTHDLHAKYEKIAPMAEL